MKKKGTWIKLAFVAALILIIIYTFRDSTDEIIEELTTTSPRILLAIFASSTMYELFEGWITWSLARRYNPAFRFRDGVYFAFTCSFYRLSTLGSGQGVAAVVFLGKRGVGYSEATGLYMIQYMVHKVSIAAFSAIFFIANWRVMSGNYSDYGIYLVGAYALTALIAAGLIIFGVSNKSHRLILFLVRKLNKKGKLDNAIEKLQESCDIMEKSTRELVTDVRVLLVMFVKTLAKLFFWYCIPFLILYGGSQVRLIDSLSITSLSVMAAAVIPSPAGIGSTELVMTALFGVLVNFQKAASVTLLYRLATFIFPFAVGAIIILADKLVKRIRG